MKRIALGLSLLLVPIMVQADAKSDMIENVVHGHILPRFEALANSGQVLSDVSATECTAQSEALKAAFNNAFDAWVSVSHLRFGPTETNDRAFALAFWPDSRGATPRALSTLLSDQDPIVASAERYSQVSIAARGFYALEFLLYDETLSVADDAAYHCQLIQTISGDIAATTGDILQEWQSDYATQMLQPTLDGIYRSDDEVLQVLFKSLSTGLQFTSETRLGRPLGTFDRPRPTRAEARRSSRSAAHVRLSLVSLEDLSGRLAADTVELKEALDASFTRSIKQLSDLNDPTFASAADPQGRFKVEAVQSLVDAIRTSVHDELGPALGVTAGFNALDGD
jgi:predicted lipoprotein